VRALRLCTATCPTYVLLGDELDSPRGRIYLMKDMLENERTPSPEVVKHVDRCLSCLSCMTTCPSGVNYLHLVDHARAYIEDRYRRPWPDRLLRSVLAAVLPHPGRLRAALSLARLARPFAPLAGRFAGLKPIAAMLALAPARLPERAPRVSVAAPVRRGRVALLQGCAEPVLRPEIRAATVRLLNRAGYDVAFAEGEGCCGSLVRHLGRDADSLDAARRNVAAWDREIARGGLDAIIVTASGCGTTIKDYGFMLRDDPAFAERSARVAALAQDIGEFLLKADLPFGQAERLTVACQQACSIQHGQKLAGLSRRLLEKAGFTARVPAEAHLCCGSAGTYNILQPDIAGQLGDRKVANLARLGADVIATDNIGCAVQIGARTALPVLHVVELLDWAAGGDKPAALTEPKATATIPH
jgi:glycolate oxidase iron-sulfur subunit